MLGMPFSSMSQKITPEEWPFMPPWCKYTQAGRESTVSPSPQAQVLITQIGKEGWAAVHHYCWGLAQLYRSHGIDLSQTEREFFMKSAVEEIDYVLANAPRNFILRPELLTKRGSILLMLKEYVQAEVNLKTAIKEQATYWPAYGYLSDVYLKQGRIDDARSILAKGLKIAPHAKGLRNRMAQLK